MAKAGVPYIRNVVYTEGWRQVVSVAEGDLIGSAFKADLCPQEETVPQSIPKKVFCR